MNSPRDLGSPSTASVHDMILMCWSEYGVILTLCDSRWYRKVQIEVQ